MIAANGKHVPGLHTWLDGSLVQTTLLHGFNLGVSTWRRTLVVNQANRIRYDEKEPVLRAICEVEGGRCEAHDRC